MRKGRKTISLCLVVKTDAVYRKIKQSFSGFEVLSNASHFNELSEIIRTEDVDLVVVDDQIHWRERAEKLLSEYEKPYILFTGNFDELVYKINQFYENPLGTQVTNSPQNSEEVHITEHNSPQEEAIQQSEKKESMDTEDSSIIDFLQQVQTRPEPVADTEPKVLVKEVIREVPKYVDREVIKEVKVPVDRVVERIVEVPVEREVEKTVIKTQVVEIKPDFDAIEPDFELPSIVPKAPAVQLPQYVPTDNINGPVLIGIMAVDEEIILSDHVFLLANSLATLKHRPLVIAQDKKEIDALEAAAFKGQEDEPDAEVFEYEGVTYMRPNVEWEYEDLLATEYSHILFWFDSLQSPRRGTEYREWSRTHHPILVGNSSMWKLNELSEALSELTDSIRGRCHLLLPQAKKDAVRELAEEYPELDIHEIPHTQDVFYPTKEVTQWVSSLFRAKKHREFPTKLLLILILTIVIAAFIIWLGLQIQIPETGE